MFAVIGRIVLMPVMKGAAHIRLALFADMLKLQIKTLFLHLVFLLLRPLMVMDWLLLYQLEKQLSL